MRHCSEERHRSQLYQGPARLLSNRPRCPTKSPSTTKAHRENGNTLGSKNSLKGPGQKAPGGHR
eukprot:2658238-Heterocapsa_arctica.AAC.1